MATPTLTLWIDESGSRHPDKKPDPSRAGRDWFAIGGIVVKSEDEQIVKSEHVKICKNWNIKDPFHMTDMLSKNKKFSWLGRITDETHDMFWGDYKRFLSIIPVIGVGCVIDRPGYVKRGYLQKHGANKWLLCRSAFDIVVERSAKMAKMEGRKLRVVFEGDVGINETIKGYFKNLKDNGLEFDPSTSSKYNPLTKSEFSSILTTIEYKNKQSELLQVADSYVYAIARQAYERNFHIYRRLRDAKRIANFAVPPQHVSEMGIKHYCFR